MVVELGFSSCRFRDAALAIEPSRKNTDTEEEMCRGNALLGSICLAGICGVPTLLIGTVLETWSTSVSKRSLHTCSGGLDNRHAKLVN